jgi:hypothetical protein
VIAGRERHDVVLADLIIQTGRVGFGLDVALCRT